jgi:dephospho-CoA kinase
MSTTNKTTQIIGIAGTFASGKDTVAHQLVADHGYTHVSTGDMVRKVAMEKYGSIERPVLFKTATELRYEFGAGALVLEALKEPRPTVISGIRTLGEAKALLEAGGTLLYIDAPVEIRYDRVKSRNRDKETELTLEQFKANEEKELYAGPNDEDFNICGIKEIADVVVENILPLDEFIKLVYSELQLA